ncbi:MAG: response regulator, partial [Nitrospirota bacterium]
MAKILVVDDERLICDLLQAVLSRHGHEVLTATKGLDVPELFRRHRPQITVLDLHLQDTNGIAVLKQIRAVDSKASVIMLTGGGTDELEHRARLLGVTDFLRKGISLEALTAAVDRAMQQPKQPVSTTRPSQEASTEGQASESILVVDDEPSVRDL